MGGVARISLQRECGCPTSACRRQMWDFDRPLLFLPARKCEGAWLQPCRKNPKIRRALAPEYHPAFKFPSFPSRPLYPPPGGAPHISLQRECGCPTSACCWQTWDFSTGPSSNLRHGNVKGHGFSHAEKAAPTGASLLPAGRSWGPRRASARWGISTSRYSNLRHGNVKGHGFQPCRKSRADRRFFAAAGRSWGPRRASARWGISTSRYSHLRHGNVKGHGFQPCHPAPQ